MGVLSISTLLTPFQFSSSKMQADTLLANNLPNSVATDLALTMLAWHEMWVNPEKITMNDKYINTGPQHTAGSIVTQHFRQDVTMMSVSGEVGYVAVQSQIEEAAATVVTLSDLLPVLYPVAVAESEKDLSAEADDGAVTVQ